MNMRVETGACFCGAIAAEMRGEPFWTCFDHDDDCRRAVGSPLSIWIGYRTDQFHLTRGTPTLYSKTKGITRSFCGRCGTSIGYLDEGLGDELYIAIGFMTHPERFKPQAHAYWKMRLPCLAFDDDLPRVDDYTRSRDSSFGNPIDRPTDHDPPGGPSSES